MARADRLIAGAPAISANNMNKVIDQTNRLDAFQGGPGITSQNDAGGFQIANNRKRERPDGDSPYSSSSRFSSSLQSPTRRTMKRRTDATKHRGEWELFNSSTVSQRATIPSSSSPQPQRYGIPMLPTSSSGSGDLVWPTMDADEFGSSGPRSLERRSSSSGERFQIHGMDSSGVDLDTDEEYQILVRRRFGSSGNHYTAFVDSSVIASSGAAGGPYPFEVIDIPDLTDAYIKVRGGHVMVTQPNGVQTKVDLDGTNGDPLTLTSSIDATSDVYAWLDLDLSSSVPASWDLSVLIGDELPPSTSGHFYKRLSENLAPPFAPAESQQHWTGGMVSMFHVEPSDEPATDLSTSGQSGSSKFFARADHKHAATWNQINEATASLDIGSSSSGNQDLTLGGVNPWKTITTYSTSGTEIISSSLLFKVNYLSVTAAGQTNPVRGATGSFSTSTKTVTVTKGLITSIVDI